MQKQKEAKTLLWVLRTDFLGRFCESQNLGENQAKIAEFALKHDKQSK